MPLDPTKMPKKLITRATKQTMTINTTHQNTIKAEKVIMDGNMKVGITTIGNQMVLIGKADTHHTISHGHHNKTITSITQRAKAIRLGPVKENNSIKGSNIGMLQRGVKARARAAPPTIHGKLKINPQKVKNIKQQTAARDSRCHFFLKCGLIIRIWLSSYIKRQQKTVH